MMDIPLFNAEKSTWIQDASLESWKAYSTHETNSGLISKKQSKSIMNQVYHFNYTIPLIPFADSILFKLFGLPIY